MEKKFIARGLAILALGCLLLAGGVAHAVEDGDVEVPNVRNLTPARACGELEAAGFSCKRGPGGEHPPDHRQWLVGRVSGQWPHGGTRHQKGSIVTIYIYAQRWVVIPDLAGKKAAQAGRLLRDLGLAVQQAWQQTGDVSQNQVVYASSPVRGAKVKPGHRVKLYAYRYVGAKVPNLAGLSETGARARVKRAGLVCVVSDKHNISTIERAKWYTVAVQKPPAGSTLGRGKKVTVFLYKKAEVAIPNDIVGMTYPVAKRALRTGCLKLRVTYKNTRDPSQDRRVWAVSPGPGSLLPCGSQVVLQVYKCQE